MCPIPLDCVQAVWLQGRGTLKERLQFEVAGWNTGAAEWESGLCYRCCMASPQSRPEGAIEPPLRRETSLARGILQQPEMTTSSLEVSPAPSNSSADAVRVTGSGRPAADPPPHRIPRWLVRLELFLRVMLRMYIGIAVCYAPWSHSFWDQNPVFLQFPTLAIYAANGAVRGIVSGLGLLNLWFAIQDALRHRDG